MALVVKNLPANAEDARDTGSIPRWGRFPSEWQPTPVFLPREFHGQRKLANYSSWSHKASDSTKQPEHRSTRNKKLHTRHGKLNFKEYTKEKI